MVNVLLPIPSIGTPHFDQQMAEVLDVGFTGGIAQHRCARGKGCGHDTVLGGGDRCFVEQDIAAGQSVIGAQLELAVVDQMRPQRVEDLKMGVDAPSTDVVAARSCVHNKPAGAGQQRTHQGE